MYNHWMIPYNLLFFGVNSEIQDGYHHREKFT